MADEPTAPPVPQDGDTDPAVATEAAQTDTIPVSEIVKLQGVNPHPGAAALPGEPLEAGQKGKATVRTRHPIDRFEHGVEGVPPITSAGVEVGPSKVAELLAAAHSAGTELERV